MTEQEIKLHIRLFKFFIALCFNHQKHVFFTRPGLTPWGIIKEFDQGSSDTVEFSPLISAMDTARQNNVQLVDLFKKINDVHFKILIQFFKDMTYCPITTSPMYGPVFIKTTDIPLGLCLYDLKSIVHNWMIDRESLFAQASDRRNLIPLSLVFSMMQCFSKSLQTIDAKALEKLDDNLDNIMRIKKWQLLPPIEAQQVFWRICQCEIENSRLNDGKRAHVFSILFLMLDYIPRLIYCSLTENNVGAVFSKTLRLQGLDLLYHALMLFLFAFAYVLGFSVISGESKEQRMSKKIENTETKILAHKHFAQTMPAWLNSLRVNDLLQKAQVPDDLLEINRQYLNNFQ